MLSASWSPPLFCGMVQGVVGGPAAGATVVAEPPPVLDGVFPLDLELPQAYRVPLVMVLLLVLLVLRLLHHLLPVRRV